LRRRQVFCTDGAHDHHLFHGGDPAAGDRQAGFQREHHPLFKRDKRLLRIFLPCGSEERGPVVGKPPHLVPQAVRALKKEFGSDVIVMTDVCLCAYTDTGHCGVNDGPVIVNDKSVEILAKMAVAHAEAGADIVAPSDMMDGRIRAMREALDQGGFEATGILSYAIKHAGAYYGPFREAADSSPKFGDRRSYQMDPRNAREGLRDALLDVEEGADALMVKPAMPNLDLIWRLREKTLCPIAAYHVSSEFSSVKAGARMGWLDEANLFREHLLAIRRAGADWIVTYVAREALEKKWI